MVKEGVQAVANGENAVKIKRKIDESVQKVVANLKVAVSSAAGWLIPDLRFAVCCLLEKI